MLFEKFCTTSLKWMHGKQCHRQSDSGDRQYIVITASGHHFIETLSGDYMIAYALSETD